MSTPSVVSQPTPPRPTPPKTGSSERVLSPFLIASIGLLVLVTIGAVILLFVGDFSYRSSRVFATLLVFALFTALTGYDTRASLTSRTYYTPFALFANVYMLSLSLIVIWVRAEPRWVPMFFLFTGVVLYVFALARVALLGASFLLTAQQQGKQLLTMAAVAASVLLAAAAVLFTIPMGLWAFAIRVPDLYWRISIAVLIITALAIAVTSLLFWAATAGQREARRLDRGAPYGGRGLAPRDWPPPAPQRPQPVLQTPQPQQTPHPQQTPPSLRPWPIMPSGRPVPSLPNGQPDLNALRRAVLDETGPA